MYWILPLTSIEIKLASQVEVNSIEERREVYVEKFELR